MKIDEIANILGKSRFEIEKVLDKEDTIDLDLNKFE